MVGKDKPQIMYGATQTTGVCQFNEVFIPSTSSF